MRVLITPEWYPYDERPSFGVFCREQARAVSRSHDVVVLSWRWDPQLGARFRIEEANDAGLRTFRLRFGHVRVPKVDGMLKLAGTATILARLRRSGWAPDVIHAHEHPAGRTALLLGRVLRVPVVVSEHHGGFTRGEVSEQELARARRVFERAAVVCADGQDLERGLRELAPGGRFESVPNVVDEEVFHVRDGTPATHDGRPLRLVTVGNLVEVKGHRHLIEALARLRRSREVTLDVIGDGPLRPELAALARSLGLDRAVRFLGQRSKQDVAAALSDADVFVLPSLGESMPCALLEALASGLPAVGTRVGDVPDVLDAERGLAVAPHSDEELAAGIETVASQLDRYDRSLIARRTRSEYGYDAIARRWTSVYARAGAGRA